VTTSYVWDYHKSNEKYKIKGALPERESKSTIPTNQKCKPSLTEQESDSSDSETPC